MGSYNSHNCTAMFALEIQKRHMLSFVKLIFHLLPKRTLTSIWKTKRDLFYDLEVQFVASLCISFIDCLSPVTLAISLVFCPHGFLSPFELSQTEVKQA